MTPRFSQIDFLEQSDIDKVKHNDGHWGDTGSKMLSLPLASPAGHTCRSEFLEHSAQPEVLDSHPSCCGSPDRDSAVSAESGRTSGVLEVVSTVDGNRARA